MTLEYRSKCPYLSELRKHNTWKCAVNDEGLLATIYREDSLYQSWSLYLVLYNQYTDVWMRSIRLSHSIPQAFAAQPIAFVEKDVLMIMEVFVGRICFVKYKLSEDLTEMHHLHTYTRKFIHHPRPDFYKAMTVHCDPNDAAWCLTHYDDVQRKLSIFQFKPPVDDESWESGEFEMIFEQVLENPSPNPRIAYANRRLLVGNEVMMGGFAIRYWVFELDEKKVTYCENRARIDTAVSAKEVHDIMRWSEFSVYLMCPFVAIAVKLDGKNYEYPYAMLKLSHSAQLGFMSNGQLLVEENGQFCSIWLKRPSQADLNVHTVRANISENKKKEIKEKLAPRANYHAFIAAAGSSVYLYL